MTDGRRARSQKNSRPKDFLGVLDPERPLETRLGANLEAEMVPEDPDDRQYWLWDVDDFEEEEPCP